MRQKHGIFEFFDLIDPPLEHLLHVVSLCQIVWQDVQEDHLQHEHEVKMFMAIIWHV